MKFESLVRKAIAKVSPAVGKEVKKKTDKVAKDFLTTAMDAVKIIGLGIILINGVTVPSKPVNSGPVYILNQCTVTFVTRG